MELRLRSENEEKDEAEERSRQEEKADEQSFRSADAIDSKLPRFAVPNRVVVPVLRLVPFTKTLANNTTGTTCYAITLD